MASSSQDATPAFRRGFALVALGGFVLLAAATLNARVEDEWSYSRLTRPAVPAVVDAGWVQSPIDAFVLARLEAAGLAPNGPASDAVLIRRATYDLTGLPPTPEAVAAYVADRAPDKYERLLDRLLASPQYGEAWGRHWLDLVRFAETDSFERDRLKPGAWRYRDWVIDSLNADEPFDRFVLAQLAGDELPDPTFGSMVATGYYRLGIWDDEPTDPQQAVYDDYDGIVDTTARVFLGVSMGCARCHDHKKDPVPTRDYYRMLAFFEGLAPYKVGGGNATAPANFVKRVPVDLGRSSFDDELRAWQIRREESLGEAQSLAREAWSRLDPATRASIGAERASGLVLHLDFDDGDVADGRVGAARKFGRRAAELRVPRPVQDDFTLALWFRTQQVGGGNPSDLRWFTGSGLIDGEVSGVVGDFGMSLIGGHVAAGVGAAGVGAAGVGDPETFVSSNGGHADGAWHHAAFVRERQSGRIALYVDGVLAGEGQGGTQALNRPETLTIGRMQPGDGPFPGDLDDVRIYARALDGREVLDLWAGGGFERGTDAAVEARVGRPEAERYRAAIAQLLALRRPVRELADVLCAREAGSAVEPSFVRVRGNVHIRGEPVQCGFPVALGGGDAEIIPPEGGESSGRRLAFARWLLQRDHPRTWRVLANRLWQYHFGRGIVRTANDFGLLGEEPTHPQLLDWIASEIVANGGRLKAVHRTLMLSSAYRMASTTREVALASDPRNDLFWRFEPRRLSAEELRDSMLAVNGTLNLAMGGPGIYPPMPPEVLATASRPDAAWGRSSPEESARRTVYVHVKRSLLMPLLQSFDVADTDSSCPVRFVTTLPTQALTMLNSELVNDAAARLAARLRREQPGDVRAQLARGLALVTQRTVGDADLGPLEALRADLMAEHRVTADNALRLCCLAMLNLNEFVYLD